VSSNLLYESIHDEHVPETGGCLAGWLAVKAGRGQAQAGGAPGEAGRATAEADRGQAKAARAPARKRV
jgi:hypothetical protein